MTTAPAAALACPKCHPERMKEEAFEGVAVHRCPSCKGLFLDQGELEALLERKLGSVADSLAFSATSDVMDALPATCPRCARAMEAGTGAEGLRLDRCLGCHAVFLEQGELATLQLMRH